MKEQDKPKEELIKELQELRQENNSLKALCDKNIFEHKKAVDALRESEEKYRLIFEYSPLGLISFDEKGIIVACNDQFVQIIGSSREKLIGLNMLSLPDKNIVSAVQKALSGSTGYYEGDYHSVTAKKITPTRVIFAPIDIGGGHIHGGVGIVEDITERKQTERVLFESERNNRLLLELAPDAFFQGNEKGDIIMANKKATLLTGYTKEELLTMNIKELFSPSILNQIPLRYDLLDKGETIILEREVTRKDGSIRTVEMNSLKMPNNTYQSFMRDITERKQAEVILHDIIAKNPMSIQIVDKEGFTIQVNSAHTRLFGSIPPSDYSVFNDFQAEKQGFGNLLVKAKNGEVVYFPDLYYNALDVNPKNPDVPIWIRMVIFPINDNNGKPERFILMHEDITKHKLAEKELIKAKEYAEESERRLFSKNEEYEALNEELHQTNEELLIAKEKADESNRLKTAFLANMSHEIRTPMNGILGFADLLKEPKLTGKQQQEYISIIEKSGKRMLNIINDIVDISKIESGEMNVLISETNINEQIEYIYTFFMPEVERKGISLILKSKLPENEASIKTDREKIYAILSNLIKNAIKFTDKGSVEFGYKLKKDIEPVELEFFVKDTGIGIPKDRQQAVFKRFIQADIADKRAFQGAGLGLSITKAFVEMLGGKIWVESEDQKGSVFYFTIPYYVKSEGNITIKNIDSGDKSDPQIKKLKILIAEDDETSDMFITLLLEKYNCEVLHANTGVKAVETCINNPDIDLVMMDIKMPKMNGYEAAMQIRQFNKKVIIFAQTAHALAGDKEKAIEAGCNDYIPKPINQAILNELIQKYFNN